MSITAFSHDACTDNNKTRIVRPAKYANIIYDKKGAISIKRVPATFRSSLFYQTQLALIQLNDSRLTTAAYMAAHEALCEFLLPFPRESLNFSPSLR